jgi:sterol desaturase/sphingolipid hydroxylase (fatty acid hydroxylase superfamily)
MTGMIRRLRLFFSFWAYPLVAAALLWAGLRTGTERSGPVSLWLIPVGVVLWTLVEYLMHRFLFHPRGNWPAFRRFAYGLHGIHHRYPRDPEEILAGPSTSLPPSLAIFLALVAGTGSLSSAAGVMTGVWAGFLYYEWVHYRVHTTNAGGLLQRHRRWHFHHHFVDDSVCFGVTSPLWDAVFGTVRKV